MTLEKRQGFERKKMYKAVKKKAYFFNFGGLFPKIFEMFETRVF